MHTISSTTASGANGARSHSIGVIVPGNGWALCSDPALPRALEGIEEFLTGCGIQMLVLHADAAASFLSGGHVDGVIVLAPEQSDLTSWLDSIGLPVVYGGRPRNGREVSFVEVDNNIAARCATQHLVEQGRRRIAHLAGPRERAASGELLQGFRDALWDAALRSDLVEHAALDRDSGELAMSLLLDFRDDIDAVFAASDAMAAGAMWAMQVRGRRVPDDVAIVGFDDSPIAARTSPPLSSVRRPIEAMGREAARLVVEMTSHERAGGYRQLTLEPVLAARESSTAYRS